MTTILFLIFVISVFIPIYTYGVYPLILMLFREKTYISCASYQPSLTVVVLSCKQNVKEKLENIVSSDYPSDAIEVFSARSIDEINNCIAMAKGELILFTNTDTEFDKEAIKNLIRRFADKRIGCVCGQLRKHTDEDGKPSESIYWRYENKVKRLESRIGRLSGANSALYAIRKEIIPPIHEKIIDLAFYNSTYVLQAGYDIVMADDAIAYESTIAKDEFDFDKNVRNGAAYYQALGLFWRMLLPRKGSFTYVSHRVMKWLVPLSIAVVFVVNGILAFFSFFMLVLFFLQLVTYITLLVYCFLNRNTHKKRGCITKIISVLLYFLSINAALVIGFFKNKRTENYFFD